MQPLPPAAFLRLPLLLAVATLACVNSPPATMDPQGDAIRFEARSGIAKANGIFHDWRVVDAEIPEDPAAGTVEVVIETASIDTGLDRRDEHLRSAEYFDVARFPRARVVVSDAVPDPDALPGDGERYIADFDITIRDHQETLRGSFVRLSETPLVVEGQVVLDRVAFGVGEPDTWWKPFAPRDEVEVWFRLTLP